MYFCDYRSCLFALKAIMDSNCPIGDERRNKLLDIMLYVGIKRDVDILVVTPGKRGM